MTTNTEEWMIPQKYQSDRPELALVTRFPALVYAIPLFARLADKHMKIGPHRTRTGIVFSNTYSLDRDIIDEWVRLEFLLGRVITVLFRIF